MESAYLLTDPAQQHKAAKVAGIAYIIQMATSMFAELYGFAPMIARGDVAKTANNIIANETTFRIGIASILFTSIYVVVLIWALYIVLRPVNKNLALLALLWRMVETAIVTVGPINQLVALKYLSSADYLKAFEPEQLYALTNISMSTYGSSLFVGFICTGLGSAVFAWLFLKSGYIPKALAGLGIFASLLLALGCFLVIIFPDLRNVVYPYAMVPMFFWEVGAGFWLWFKGVKIPEMKPVNQPA